MRTLLFIFTLILAANATAQSPLLSRSFTDGTSLAKAGEFEKAAKTYRNALIIAHDENLSGRYLGTLHFNLGVCHYRMGRETDAILEFHKAIRLSRGKYQRAYYALGMAQSGQKNWRKAREAFIGALKLKDADGEAWFDLGFVYLADHDYENAGRAFRNSISHKSIDSALGHNNVGVILAMNNNFAAAEKEFEAALIGSGGRLIEARKNLDYCRSRRAGHTELVATTEFSFAERQRQIIAV